MRTNSVSGDTDIQQGELVKYFERMILDLLHMFNDPKYIIDYKQLKRNCETIGLYHTFYC